jgi:HEAT repeat protein
MTLPGATVDISVPMIAPSSTDANSHRGHWQMRTADGKFFGQDVFVLIRIESSVYKGRTFEDWEADLQVDAPAVRKEAIKALARFSTRATSVLIKTFHSDSDEGVRVLAIGALSDIIPPTQDIVRVLMEAAMDPSPVINSTAWMVIYEVLPSRIGPEIVPFLVETTRDENVDRRMISIRLLLALNPPVEEALPTLREMAGRDPDPKVRKFAEETLNLIGSR